MSKTITTALLARDPVAQAFYARDFRDPLARAEGVHNAIGRRPAPELLAEIARQQSRLLRSAPRDAQVARLSEGGVLVVTGQQTGLFLGPLYTLWKAASAVVFARLLETETGVACIPMFWLQTEDHDADEIDHCFIRSRDGTTHRVSIDLGASRSPRVSVAHRRLGDDVEAALTAVSDYVSVPPTAEDSLHVLRDHWRPGRRVSEAFAQTLATLFAPEGLLVFDPRNDAMAGLAAPLHRRAVEEHEALACRLTDRACELASAGFAPQVSVRPHACLSFVHFDGPTEARYRPIGVGDTWTLPGTGELTTAELLACLDRSPLSFSTSALLRPIVQDALLPVVAYVGGPAEVAYFAQLQPLYDAFHVPSPMVVPRAHFAIVDRRNAARMERLGLSLDTLGSPPRATGPGPAPPVDRELSDKAAPLLEAIGAAAGADPQLARALVRTRATIDRAIARFAQRHDRVLALRHDARQHALGLVRDALLPLGSPQERLHAFPSWAADAGPRALVDAAIRAIDPLDPRLRELRP